MENFSIFDTEELFALAEIDMKKENFSGALEKIKYIIARSQVPIESYSMLGRLYATIGLFEKAKEAFQFFIQHVPDAVNEHFQLGMVERDMGNFDAAITVWDEVLEQNENYAPALYHKAVILAEKNEIKPAVELLNLLLETATEQDEFIPLADQMLSRLSLQ